MLFNAMRLDDLAAIRGAEAITASRNRSPRRKFILLTNQDESEWMGCESRKGMVRLNGDASSFGRRRAEGQVVCQARRLELRI